MKLSFSLIISVLVLALLFGCTSTSTKINVSDSDVNLDINNLNTAQIGSVTHSINIMNLSFTPFIITINQGDTITWTNNDTMPHTVTGGELNSAVLQKNETFSYTFNTKGTIDYICTIHPSMKGKVIVQ